MSLRSRNFIAGAVGGFFRANNNRRNAMQERLQTMADDKATREREQAKTEYTQAITSAQAENAKYSKYKEEGWLNEDDTFTDAYWRSHAMADHKATGNKEPFNQNSIDNYRKVQGRRQKFERRYKDPSAANQSLNETYDSIALRQKEEAGRSSLTNFDRMLMGGIKEEEVVDRESPRFDPSSMMNENMGDGDPVTETEQIFEKPEEKEVNPMLSEHIGRQVDGQGNPIGPQLQLIFDKRTKTYSHMVNGKSEEVNFMVQIEDKQKTGLDSPKIASAFESPLKDKTNASPLRQKRETVTYMNELYDVVSTKLDNPKDWADRLIETTANQLSAILGFDGTESDMVNAWFNSTTEEQKAEIRELFGHASNIGVEDQIHKGSKEALELYSTYSLARTMAGGGKTKCCYY